MRKSENFSFYSVILIFDIFILHFFEKMFFRKKESANQSRTSETTHYKDSIASQVTNVKSKQVQNKNP